MNKTDAFTFLLHTLALNGIEAPLEFNSSTKQFYLQISTGAKSHLHLYFRDDEIFAEMRYNETAEFKFDHPYHDNGELLYWVQGLFRDCMCGRDYAAMGVHSVLSNGWKTLDNLDDN